MLHEDLILHYNSVCEKHKEMKEQRDKAIERANIAIALNGCFEVELAGLRQELKESYREISELKHGR